MTFSLARVVYPDSGSSEFRSIAQDQHAPIKAMLHRLKARYPQVAIMHTFDVPCSNGICKLDFDHLHIYRYNDYHHLSLAGVRYISENTSKNIRVR